MNLIIGDLFRSLITGTGNQERNERKTNFSHRNSLRSMSVFSLISFQLRVHTQDTSEIIEKGRRQVTSTLGDNKNL